MAMVALPPLSEQIKASGETLTLWAVLGATRGVVGNADGGGAGTCGCGLERN